MEFAYKTKPFEHQDSEFTGHRDDLVRGLLWEMGTGKSKVDVDEMAYLYLGGKIDGHFIVAPAGVHRNWIVNEIPIHLMPGVLEQTRMHSYSSEKAKTKGHEQAVKDVVNHKGLAVLAMSYDALVTDRGAAAAKEFLTKRRCMYTADEARRIKSPGADRTKYVLKSSRLATYRRLLNGTPVPNGPFDLYSQMLFLDPNFWKPLGISTFSAFKAYFGVFIKGHCSDGSGGVREFPQLVSYRNLDVLHKILDSICTRVTKDDVLKDLPEKLYTRRSFELTGEARRVYDTLSEDFIAHLGGGDIVTAPLALTRLLRLQQITSGFVPADTNDDNFNFIDLGKNNPRLDMLVEMAEDVPHKVIIWARFRRSIDKIMDALGKRAVRYDGSVDEDGRARALEAMEKGDEQFFVANAATAGEGLTIVTAKSSYYYENTYNLAERLQSEDRNHRIGQDGVAKSGQDRNVVEYTDFVATDTVDEHVTLCLQKKLDIAAKITGDKLKRMVESGVPSSVNANDDVAALMATATADALNIFMGA